MNVEDLLQQIDDTLEKAISLPLSGGRCVVDVERLRAIVDDIRLNVPSEVKQAKNIVSDRVDIIAGAKREAEAIVHKAEDRARALVAQDEITRQAQAKANDIVSQAQVKAREMRKAAQDFIDDLMLRADDSLAKTHADVRKVRMSLKASAVPPPPKTKSPQSQVPPSGAIET